MSSIRNLEHGRHFSYDKTNLVPDLPAFLHRLAPHHLQELAEQCGIKAGDISKDKSPAVKGILQYLDKNPGKVLRLRNKAKTKPLKLELEKGKTYFLGLGATLHPVPPKYPKGKDIPPKHPKEKGPHPVGEVREWEFELPEFVLPAWMEALIVMGFGPDCFFLPGMIIEGQQTIRQDTTVITDMAFVRFEGGLKMEHGSKFYGVHRCGLWLEVTDLTGATSSEISTAEAERPKISTAIRPVAVEDEDLFDPSPVVVSGTEDLYLYRLKEGKTLDSIDGDSGDWGHSLTMRLGDAGDAGFWQLIHCIEAEDGESMAGIAGEKGNNGEDGEDGYSPAPLAVVIENSLSRLIKFDASGGNGGTGGRGGKGQDVKGGRGGNLTIFCTSEEPGSGGAGGQGGDYGRGGPGGNGGNGGIISLKYPVDTDENLLIAYTKGGDIGQGGQHGLPGRGIGGDGGLRYNDVTRRYEGRSNERRGPAGTAGEMPPLDDNSPALAASGLRGLNGRIRVNGETVVSGGNRSKVPDQFTHPDPGTTHE